MIDQSFINLGMNQVEGHHMICNCFFPFWQYYNPHKNTCSGELVYKMVQVNITVPKIWSMCWKQIRSFYFVSMFFIVDAKFSRIRKCKYGPEIHILSKFKIKIQS